MPHKSYCQNNTIIPVCCSAIFHIESEDIDLKLLQHTYKELFIPVKRYQMNASFGRIILFALYISRNSFSDLLNKVMTTTGTEKAEQENYPSEKIKY